MRFLLLYLSLSLISCAPFTATHAPSGTVAKGRFTDRGRSGSITMKLPDGEILKGQYSALREGEMVSEDFTSATATIQSTGNTQYSGQVQSMGGLPLANYSGQANTSLLTTATLNAYGISSVSSGQGLARGWIKSTTTDLFMEMAVRYGVFGGGYGVAQDNKGRTWKVYLGN